MYNVLRGVNTVPTTEPIHPICRETYDIQNDCFHHVDSENRCSRIYCYIYLEHLAMSEVGLNSRVKKYVVMQLSSIGSYKLLWSTPENIDCWSCMIVRKST